MVVLQIDVFPRAFPFNSIDNDDDDDDENIEGIN